MNHPFTCGVLYGLTIGLIVGIVVAVRIHRRQRMKTMPTIRDATNPANTHDKDESQECVIRYVD
jgi:hypothetical protein